MSQPTIFLAYANDAKDGLKQLYPEVREIRNILNPLRAKGWDIYPAPVNNSADFVNDLQNNRGQINIFHFAGHADSFKLHFGKEQLDKINLKELLKAENDLVLVFLNACATKGHVEACFEAGANAVIATDIQVPDVKAYAFSTTFYRSLINNQSLEQSFQDAKAAVAGDDPNDWIVRGFVRDGALIFPSDETARQPIYWRLHPAKEEALHWKLSDVKVHIPRYLTLAPPLPPLEFIGRKEELEQLTQHLNTGNQLLLMNGTGGIGKTALAQKYCQVQMGQYKHICWITCNPYVQDSVVGSLIGQNLNITFPEDADTEQRFRMIWNTLANMEGPNLLVLDNANDTADLEKNRSYFRQLPHWKILLTTRTNLPGFPKQEINTLPPAQAMELFKSHVEIAADEEEQLAALLKTIEYHTLSIELLAKSLNKRKGKGYHLQQMAEELEREGILQLSQSGRISTDYQNFKYARPEAVIRAMFTIDPLSETYQKRLIQWTLFPPTFIPLDHLRVLFSIQEEHIRDFEDECEDLYLFGWLEANEALSEYRMHPLIQEVLYDKYQPDYDYCEALIQQAVAIANQPSLPAKYPFIPYLETISNKIKAKNQQIALLNGYLSEIYYAIGNFPKTAAWANEASRYFPRYWRYPKSCCFSYQIRRISTSPGEIRAGTRVFSKRPKTYRRTLSSQSTVGKPQKRTRHFLEKLGSIYQAQGKFEQALEFFNNAQTYLKNSIKPIHSRKASKTDSPFPMKNLARSIKPRGNSSRHSSFF